MTELLFKLSHPRRAFASLFACGFAIGSLNHGHDILQGGLLPYRTVPILINAFWTALCPLDLALAILVWFRARAAIAAGLALLLVDVGVNSWLAYFSGLQIASFEPLQVQSMFLGFVLGGALFRLCRERPIPQEI